MILLLQLLPLLLQFSEVLFITLDHFIANNFVKKQENHRELILSSKLSSSMYFKIAKIAKIDEFLRNISVECGPFFAQ